MVTYTLSRSIPSFSRLLKGGPLRGRPPLNRSTGRRRPVPTIMPHITQTCHADDVETVAARRSRSRAGHRHRRVRNKLLDRSSCEHSVSFVPASGTRAVRWPFSPEAPLDRDTSSSEFSSTSYSSLSISLPPSATRIPLSRPSSRRRRLRSRCSSSALSLCLAIALAERSRSRHACSAS